ncbi:MULTISPECIES: hypothetical protein [Ochrobactrum]|uniref:Uncharacterized protein n=1 Tax=Ochrobactrum soli TaxID=2448455 RepID=A0A2P9HH52_9HYPH|nr:hypothetical protein [[Ochrobactrum] soli]MBM7331251.1 hypothetical protein [Agrobacterium sp. S2]MCI1000554.1 hypothetical protein [Ochrobactrum sp. C6C9]RRD24702.1 hypothetical protein ECB98_13315 [Brucellaceae bacterium VT-16-1752]WHT44103.1 hypothetical protein QLQ11_14180 [Ochrobactrum sp. SSR]SPL63393.1 hypothetical protein OHAE_3325 [[Ochrobactrum] soli]
MDSFAFNSDRPCALFKVDEEAVKEAQTALHFGFQWMQKCNGVQQPQYPPDLHEKLLMRAKEGYNNGALFRAATRFVRLQ